jgi:hypothetical protein
MSDKQTDDDNNVKTLLPNEAWDAIKRAKAALAEIQRIFKENENKINHNE